MKQLLLIISLALPFFLSAQNVEGEIQYEQRVKFKIDLPEGQEHLLEKLPTAQTFEKILFLKGNESLYRDLEEGENTDETIESTEEREEGTVRMKMVIARPQNKLYKNLEKGEIVDSRDFMGRKFLIEDKLKSYDWKLTGEQEEILGYSCQKASFQKEDDTIEAWFTTQIPTPNGPDNYGQLPGLILKVVSDNGDREIVATSIKLEPIPEDASFVATKGKKISQEEYDKIVAEKRKEMEEEGGGGFQIKIRQN